MNIQTVKDLGEQYLVNDAHSVPKAPGNSHYKLVSKWLKTNNLTPLYSLEEKKDILHQDNINKKGSIFTNGASVTHDSNTYLCSRELSLLLASNIVANGNSDVPWEDIEGNLVILTTAQQKGLMKVFRDKGVAIQTKFKTIEAHINSLTKDNIDDFNIEAAWSEEL